ncbi:NAD-dependent epimerase/dehydratase family protein [Bdellovibrio sp. HCB209]|uniref:NAD-dependent epimerase/dehydratase family protein n=1 Tax=Bdellovibrio sp. HCB209 TaxID=3394354 RepID=UPI0039B41DDA
MISESWKGRRVFITGHTGFRGSHLAAALKQAGAQVFGYSLSPTTNPSYFEVANVAQGMTSTFGDVRDGLSLKSALEYSEAEVVFHLAGGGGLRDSWDMVPETYASQVMGTINLFESLRETATVRAVVLLSSDKVYRSKRSANEPAVETDPLAGSSPAATAKACTDLILESYLNSVFSPDKYNKHKIALASARMGAVIGGGDFSPESFIWQLAQATQAGLDLPLKNPSSLRPWMHVDDAVNALVTLAEGLLSQGPKAAGVWNFGPTGAYQATVGQVAEAFKGGYQGRGVAMDSGVGSTDGLSVHGLLNSDKATMELGWQLQIKLPEVIQKTALWYRDYFG